MLHAPVLSNSTVSLKELELAFQCLILVCRMTQLILHPDSFSVEALSELETVSIKHQRLYLSCHDKSTLARMLPVLLHIVAQIKRTDLVTNTGLWDLRANMRCENKKKLFNVPFSASEFFQINFSHYMLYGNNDARHGFLDLAVTTELMCCIYE